MESDKFSIKLISTGQHKDMVAEVIKTFQLRIDIDLNIMKKQQTLEYITSKVLNKLVGIFNELSPSLVLVQGDTSSAFSAALAAFYCKILLDMLRLDFEQIIYILLFPRKLIGD